MDLKILHIGNTFFPESTGSTLRLYNLLIRLPYDIKLYVPDKTIAGKKIQKKEETFANINVRRLSFDFDRGFMDFIPPLRRLRYRNMRIESLRKAIQEEEFDIIHIHGVGMITTRLEKPLIYEMHAPVDMASSSYLPKYMAFLSHLYFRKKEAEVIRTTSDHIIALTESSKSWINSHYKVSTDKITVVPNGVDINILSPQKEYKKKAEELKEKLNLADNIVMYAGYMDRINGMIDLARIIPPIITERPDTSFVFIGHGPEEDKITALSRKYPQNIKFLPMVHYDEMPIYYQICDAFIIPRPSTISSETVTPLKLLEVMAMEKPVLGSNVGGIAEVINHGENGYLYEKGNMNSFKKTLLEVLDADNSQIGKNARKIIVDNYTWDKSAKILQKVYEDLV